MTRLSPDTSAIADRFRPRQAHPQRATVPGDGRGTVRQRNLLGIDPPHPHGWDPESGSSLGIGAAGS